MDRVAEATKRVAIIEALVSDACTEACGMSLTQMQFSDDPSVKSLGDSLVAAVVMSATNEDLVAAVASMSHRAAETGAIAAAISSRLSQEIVESHETQEKQDDKPRAIAGPG